MAFGTALGYDVAIKRKGVPRMHEQETKLLPKAKRRIACAVMIGMAVGAILGVLAYANHWLG